MKKLILCFSKKKVFILLAFFELFSLSLSANPGDTTWVTVYNQQQLTHYGNYDTVATFPTGLRYRKIRMHYILGRYACAGGSQYCGSWDYTTQIYARPAGKDSVEIARIITPYATDWLNTNIKHDYVVEVTDYASVLAATTAMRFNYSGYSWGFTITLKFEMIEGVPPMDALSVKNIYDGYFTYGDASNSIENYLTPKTFSYTAPVSNPFIKNTVSGHGSDANGCGEFCSKYYQLKINNNMISQKQLWRSDCGLNNVYPQTGTWVFERANWCPGAVVLPIYHDLSAITSPNATFSVNIDMEPYTVSNPSAGFNFVSQLINYSQLNKVLDVSIEDIIAPTFDDNYLRANPTCGKPVIKIKNTGTTPITSAVFNYGLKGTTPLSYTWTGTLNFLQETEVILQPTAPIFTNTADAAFAVSVASVNGIAGDDNLLNNTYESVATPVVVFPADFVIKLFTNNATDTATQKNETRWTLFDQANNVIASRINLANNTVFLDTMHLQPGCYHFQIDDSGCDGFSWWYYQYYVPNPGNGSLRFDLIGANNTIAIFSGDIGCQYIQYFSVLPASSNVGIKSYASENNIAIYPNPAQNLAYLKLDLNKAQNVTYKITDINGRIIQQKTLGKIEAGYEPVDVSLLSDGVYFVLVQLESGMTINKKLVIQR